MSTTRNKDRAFNAKASVADVSQRLAQFETREERLEYHRKVGVRLLAHRYRYYALDAPLLKDHEYDWLEKFYEEISRQLDVPPRHSEMVGFKEEAPDATEAKELVGTILTKKCQ